MKIEPLKLIVIPMILLLFLSKVEEKYLWPDQQGDIATKQVGDQRSDSSSKVESPSTEDAKSLDLQNNIPDKYIKMTLVVGQTGSLKGGKETIYTEPDINSNMAGALEYNCAVVAKEHQSKRYSDEWVYVDLLGAGDGYVKKNAVKIVNVAFGSENPLYHQIIKTALNYMGAPFVMNGDSLIEGIDCSHFASKMYQKNGVDIPDKPVKQRKAGILVDEQDRQPGDIIFYDKANNGSGHVGIYLGDGYVNNPDEFEGGFIINSTGHSGKKYPEGGVRIVCLKYPDRDHYEVVRFQQEKGEKNTDE